MSKFKHHCKRIWHFLWKDESVWSWIANIIVAFLIIRYVIYPVLGIVLGTGFPIVAVVSESMQHSTDNNLLCGKNLPEFKESFTNYWDVCGKWYEENQITKEDFRKYPFKNGFDKGDVIILWRANGGNIKNGDVVVFQGSKPQPIIHRAVRTWEDNGKFFVQTKGDHNAKSIEGSLGETKIGEDRILGKGLLRIPYLGWMKILFVDAVKPLGITITQ